MDDCTEERFLKEVEQHQMTVLRDDGVNRHIRFRKPGTGNMGFDLITWPGYLCYTGDMGTYVFSRLRDMFEFFRTDREHQRKDGRTLFINRGYWAEKVQAVDKSSGLLEYSADKFREVVSELLDGMDASAALREAVEDEVLCAADEGGQAAHDAASGFKFEGKHVFRDFWEYSLDIYTFRFVWCCYALAWGIEQYDKAKPMAKLKDELNDIAKVLDVELFRIYKAKMGFCLLMFPFNSPGISHYLSNASREDMITVLRETADRLERGQDNPR
jgi:hypothetical protein